MIGLGQDASEAVRLAQKVLERRGGRGNGPRPKVGILEPEPHGEVGAVAPAERYKCRAGIHPKTLPYMKGEKVEVRHGLLHREK